MDKEKKQIELEEKMEKDRVIDYLVKLIEGLKSETLCIQSGGELVTLKPSSFICFSLEAVTKKEKEKLKLELSWCTEKTQCVSEFHIMASEPEERLINTK